MAAPKKPTAGGKDDALLVEIRERFQYALDEWRSIREEGAADMRYVAGNPWSAKDRKAREDAGRPCLALDELGQYFNQVINDVRANPRGIKYTPTGDGANDQGAEFYQDKVREIEYRSHAQDAYVTAFENAVQRSYGYCRVNTKFGTTAGQRFLQELWIQAIPNPDQVLPDPDAQLPSLADMRYCFVFESRERKAFTKEFPDAKLADFSPELEAQAPQWLQGDKIRIAEYWKVEATKRTLLQLQTTEGLQEVWLDELEQRPSAEHILDEREVEDTQVIQYLTNGVEILKRTPWAGSYIPIIACLGKVLYVDDGSGAKKQVLSMTRLARDPYMLYCYYRTCEAELVGMTPKFPYFTYEGQLSPSELVNLQKSLHEPVAVVQVKPTLDSLPGNQPLGFPQRQPYEPPIVGIEAGAEAARRAIQAAMGVSPLPTQAQRHNDKSGVALKQIEASGQRGTFHFVDHYDGMIRQVGVVIEDLMDKIYDTARETAVRRPNDTAEVVPINQPPTDPNQPALTTIGSYAVTVSTAPSYDSTRQMASDFADTLVTNQVLPQVIGPEKFAKLIALAIKLKALGPVTDEMAKLIDPDTGKDGQEPDPAQLQQQLQQAMQEVQQLKPLADQTQAELLKVHAKGQIDKELKGAELSFQREKLERESETRITVAELSAKVDRLTLFLEERARLGVQEHEAVQANLDRAHDVGMAALEHAQGLEAGAQQAAQQQAQQADDGAQA